MVAKAKSEIEVPCAACHLVNIFKQPYAYHAGFGNQGFLYNDSGTLTLTWSSYDPAYEAIVGKKHPWMLADADRAKLEEMLLPAPDGGRWRFSNPPRCRFCGHPIGDPIGRNIYYLLYDGSIDADCPPGTHGLIQFFRPKLEEPISTGAAKNS
jgi:hypothetical protein